MGLHPQNIGKTMTHGFAGCYARQPDMIVNTRPAGGGAAFPFGMALGYDAQGAVVPMGAGSTAEQFVGVAGFEIKSSLSYLDQSRGEYSPGDAVSVFQRGGINVVCQKGTPALGKPVYLRVAQNAAAPSAALGGFEAEADGENTVQLANCQWAGPADPNGVAELRILSMINA